MRAKYLATVSRLVRRGRYAYTDKLRTKTARDAYRLARQAARIAIREGDVSVSFAVHRIVDRKTAPSFGRNLRAEFVVGDFLAKMESASGKQSGSVSAGAQQAGETTRRRLSHGRHETNRRRLDPVGHPTREGA